jgi:hypothetical protein
MLLKLSALTIAIALVNGALYDGRPHANFLPKPTIPVIPLEQFEPVTSRKGSILPPYNTTYFFQQLIDHNNVNALFSGRNL